MVLSAKGSTRLLGAGQEIRVELAAGSELVAGAAAHLAKLGFSQLYTYFAWRNTKTEIAEYFTELARSELREFFRPSLWPNTPDILTEYLQWGGGPAFVIRLDLAATLAASYGICGPACGFCESRPLEPGGEEYLDSEKYEIRHFDIGREDSLAGLIAQVNRTRRDNAVLREDWGLRFHNVDNDQLVCFSKATADFSDVIVVVVNLEYRYRQSGWVKLDLQAVGLDAQDSHRMDDLLAAAHYLWSGPRNYVELDLAIVPAHVFRLRRRAHSEETFAYFLQGRAWWERGLRAGRLAGSFVWKPRRLPVGMAATSALSPGVVGRSSVVGWAYRG